MTWRSRRMMVRSTMSQSLASAALAALLVISVSPGADAQAPGGPAAGGVPTLAQQPSGIIGQPGDGPLGSGPSADAGTVLTPANDNSGTTTTYAASAPQVQVAWPCAQRRVPTISAGTIWSGPDLARGKGWDQDDDVANLAQKLASRRLPIDEADPLIAGLAKQAGAEKDRRLTALFGGTLEIINRNRRDLLQGIMRYAQGQERLAERMRAESDKISEGQSDVQGPTGIAANDTSRDFAWDQRIFKERKQALSYVCETPSLLERRAYEIGKRIQAQL